MLLYPFYLRDRRPEKYRGVWLSLGNFLRDRYGAVWFLVIIGGGTTFNVTSGFIRSPLAYLLLMMVYLLFSGLLLLYPYHLRYRYPERYVGFWRHVGEWMGEPVVAFPKRKE